MKKRFDVPADHLLELAGVVETWAKPHGYAPLVAVAILRTLADLLEKDAAAQGFRIIETELRRKTPPPSSMN